MEQSFTKLKAGMVVLGLHGAMKQMKRVTVYDSFCRKKHVVLFATDIAARGLGEKIPLYYTQYIVTRLEI